MRFIIVMLMLGLLAAAGAVLAPRAEAQTDLDVRSLTPFSQAANYMSIPGYLRYRYFLSSGRWISREQAAQSLIDPKLEEKVAPTGAG
jgi:hypothetical protein